MSTTSTDADKSCPRIEAIAALIDGRLIGAEHEEITAHLGECESCYELFAETLRFQHEERGFIKGRVVPHPTFFSRRPAWAAGFAVAAAALVAAVLLVPRLGGGLDETLPADQIVALMAQDVTAAKLTESAYSGLDWPRTRGSFVGSSSEQLSFRIGVRMVDLAASIRAGDGRRSEEYLVETIEMARTLPNPSELLASSEQLLERLMDGERADMLAENLTTLDRLLIETADDPYYTLGKWAEAGLLATRIGNADLLTDSAFRRFPERRVHEDLPESLGTLLAGARARLRDQPLDTAALEQAFEEIARQGGRL